jgi:hypothetical protein
MERVLLFKQTEETIFCEILLRSKIHINRNILKKIINKLINMTCLK